jgi:hypothetical protein
MGAPLGALYRSLYTVYTKPRFRRSEAVFFVYKPVHEIVHTIVSVHGIGGVHEILTVASDSVKRTTDCPSAGSVHEIVHEIKGLYAGLMHGWLSFVYAQLSLPSKELNRPFA